MDIFRAIKGRWWDCRDAYFLSQPSTHGPIARHRRDGHGIRHLVEIFERKVDITGIGHDEKATWWYNGRHTGRFECVGQQFSLAFVFRSKIGIIGRKSFVGFLCLDETLGNRILIGSGSGKVTPSRVGVDMRRKRQEYESYHHDHCSRARRKSTDIIRTYC